MTFRDLNLGLMDGLYSPNSYDLISSLMSGFLKRQGGLDAFLFGLILFPNGKL